MFPFGSTVLPAALLDDLSGRGITTLFGIFVGFLASWTYTRWQRMLQRRSILRGDARDTVTIHQHIVECDERPDPKHPGRTVRVPRRMRIRAVGQTELKLVIPNGHLSTVFLKRARQVTSRDTLISMEGPEGSFLLETLTGFVCDRLGNGAFGHDLYVMAPCCEPHELAEHQPITILLIAVDDLRLFESWPLCQDVEVEHGGDGARILTLMALAKRYRQEQEQIVQLRLQKQRTKYIETMYVLDLALDKTAAAIPTRRVPWDRYTDVLEGRRLEQPEDLDVQSTLLTRPVAAGDNAKAARTG